MNELEILEAEYQRMLTNPVFDAPEMYTTILDLIMDRIEDIQERYANF